MRTTLDIDDVVLSAARGLADVEGISLGKAVSELAMRGIRVGLATADAPSRGDYVWPGFVPLPENGLALLTTEQIRGIVDEMDDEYDRRQLGLGLGG